MLVTAVPSHMLSRQSLMGPPACALMRSGGRSVSCSPFCAMRSLEAGLFRAGELLMLGTGLPWGLGIREGEALSRLSRSGLRLTSASDSALCGRFCCVLRQRRGTIETSFGSSSCSLKTVSQLKTQHVTVPRDMLDSESATSICARCNT